jgi:hypothetical protein
LTAGGIPKHGQAETRRTQQRRVSTPTDPPATHRVVQVYDYEYDLILRPDINTRGHTQWFYFSVSNTRHNVPYKFNIINMVKSDSLYQDGMQPLVFSEKDSVAHGKMWKRNGSNISYYQVRHGELAG